MAVNEGLIAKREHQIAILAVLATVVVGVASALVSCQSSRDSQRTTREAQRETARAQRAQADLRELRSVLDRAAAHLRTAAGAVLDMGRSRRPHSVSPRLMERAQSAVNTAYGSLTRLEIRLGEDAAATLSYKSATDGLSSAAGYALERRFRYADTAWDEVEEDTEDFLQEARKLVGSQLPE